MRNILVIIARNEQGIIARAISPFSSRGVPMDNIVIIPIKEFEVLRISLIFSGNCKLLEEVIKQLYKQVYIINVKNIANSASVEQEFIRIKISASVSEKLNVKKIVNIFKAKIMGFSENTMIAEILAERKKIFTFRQLLGIYKIWEITRTQIIFQK